MSDEQPTPEQVPADTTAGATPQAPTGFADPSLLAGMARQDQRVLSLHVVLMGAAALVAAILMDACGLVLGILAALVVLAVCGRALAQQLAQHEHLARRFANLVRSFLVVLAAGLVVSLVGTFWRSQGDPVHNWIIWLGGLIGLAAGLAAGHLVAHAPVAAPDEHAVH